MRDNRPNKQPEFLSFDLLNAILAERLGGATFYIGKEWSFLKIFQHALNYAANRQDSKLLNVNWAIPVPAILLRECIRSVRGKRAARPSLREILIVDPGRSVIMDGKPESVYFGRIVPALGRERITIITTRKEGQPYSDYLRADLMGAAPFPDRAEIAMIRELSAAFHATKRHRSFNEYELMHLSSAMEVFLSEFCFWYNLLKDQPVKRCLFTSHYHNEGLVAACKILGVSCEELQHGLIARNDLYNVYPEIYSHGMRNAFFPDVLYVYGEYWKSLLLSGCEHPDEKIIVAGNYLLGSDPEIGVTAEKQNIILVCSQKKMATTYGQIISVLRQVLHAHKDWSLLLRLHPLEDEPARYHAMAGDRIRICPREMSLAECMRISKIQISVYSTTFFDALGFDVVNYAVNATGFERYVSEMVEDGVALPMSLADDPIVRYEDVKRKGLRLPERSDVYAPFNAGVFIRS
ncbi:MAG: hypothetical protein ACK500_13580 [Flavobacteriales bacterium]